LLQEIARNFLEIEHLKADLTATHKKIEAQGSTIDSLKRDRELSRQTELEMSIRNVNLQ
jgi:hypothetical protein